VERKHTGRVPNSHAPKTPPRGPVQGVHLLSSHETTLHPIRPHRQSGIPRCTFTWQSQTSPKRSNYTPDANNKFVCRIRNRLTITVLSANDPEERCRVRRWNRSHTRGILMLPVVKLSPAICPSSSGSSWSSPCSRTRKSRGSGLLRLVHPGPILPCIRHRLGKVVHSPRAEARLCQYKIVTGNCSRCKLQTHFLSLNMPYAGQLIGTSVEQLSSNVCISGLRTPM